MISASQSLYEKAKRLIPGGTQLLSKRPEMFAPENWPAYYREAQGCEVIDLDGNRLLDMSIMGIGTCLLGYNDPDVSSAVIRRIKAGSMSSLNNPEEVELAEALLEIHPWAEQVRYSRTGGEAMAIAVRIARAKTRRNIIAFCGYHGWHDWYLSSNITNKNNLDSHISNNIRIAGVNKKLKNTTYLFQYNDLEKLEYLLKNKNIGIIKMEVERNTKPKNNFLKQVRRLANKYKAVLIFDECTSGFRETFGGLHKFYNVEPDIAIFGKALGNGYAINAIIGKKSVMSYASSTFISSTFWTERVGPAAALETLNVMEKTKSWQKITLTGKKI